MRIRRAAIIILAGLILLTGPVFAQGEDTRQPDDQPPANLPPEQWDEREPSGLAWDSTSSALDDTFLVKKNFWRASAEVVGVNLLVWTYNRFIREGGENPGFRVGFKSWAENLKNGFEWDDNSFSTNQFAHPFHGSLYFNAARGNGYDFWESVPFAFAGSFMWEYFGEQHHPAMNDWIATAVGGSALGEMLFRFSQSIRDNTATGGERAWREVGAFLVNPIGGLNRIIDGEWSKVHPNPVDRHPKNYRSRLDVGLRQTAENHLFDTDTTRVYAEFDFDYGDPFFGDMGKPYSHFQAQLQLNFGDKTGLGRVDVDGLLAGTFLKQSDSTSHILGAFHYFDYVNNNQLEFGAQSVGAGLLSRFETVGGLDLRTEVHGQVIILGGNSSDYESVSGRSYDYGPGLGFQVKAEFGKNGWQFLRMHHQSYFINAVNGNDAQHFLSATRVQLAAPLARTLGASIDYAMIHSERNYADYPDFSLRTPQLRLALTFIMY